MLDGLQWDTSLEVVFFCLLVEIPCLLHYPALSFILAAFRAFQDLYKFSVYMFQWQAQALHISNPHGLIQSMFPHLSWSIRWGRLQPCVVLFQFIDQTPRMDLKSDSLPASSRALHLCCPDPVQVLGTVLCQGGICPAWRRSSTSDLGSFLQIQLIPSLMV